jgi:hypothetical protein
MIIYIFLGGMGKEQGRAFNNHFMVIKITLKYIKLPLGYVSKVYKKHK